MIEFNLLPDVKLQYVKTERTKRFVILVSQLAIVVALVVFVFFIIFVDVVQKKNIRDLNGQISDVSQQLQNIPSLNKILTIQNQLQALPALEKQKPVASRLFAYMAEITPSQVTISNLGVDFTAHTFELTGNADSIATINQFVDTLKFTTFSTGANSQTSNAFSDVELSSFSTADKGASYGIKLNYDPAIFDAANSVTLTVPKIISTRSETEQPSDLFKQSTTAKQ